MYLLDKFILTLAASAVAAMAAILIHYNHMNELTRREAIKAGLVEGFLPGSRSKVWMKPAP